MSKKFRVEVVVPEGLKPGDAFLVEIEIPKNSGKPRGVLKGIDLEDMTDDQLKREIINASSVLYKAKQREAAPEIIEANQARLDAAKAVKAKREPVAEVEVLPTLTAAIVGTKVKDTPVYVSDEVAEEPAYEPDIASEI